MKDNTTAGITYIIFKLFFCIALIAGITFLVYYFNNHNLMWWYLLPVLSYLSI